MTYSYLLQFANTFDNVTRLGDRHTTDVLQIVPVFDGSKTDLCIMTGCQDYIESKFAEVAKSADKIAFPVEYNEKLISLAANIRMFDIFCDGVYTVVSKN